MTSMNEKPVLEIDGKSYDLSDLTDAAQETVNSLKYVEAGIARLNAEIAIAKTAKNAYINALKQQIE